MEMTKERMLEIAEILYSRDFCFGDSCCKHCEKVQAVDSRDVICFYNRVIDLLKADADGRLVLLPCKVDDDTESDLTKALRCLASQDPEGDCFMESENMRRYETGERIIECRSNPIEGERCPFHQSTYGVCFEDGECMEWLRKAADEIIMLRAALEKMGGGKG